MRELLDTEITYCEQLKIIVDKHFSRLEKILDIEDIETIFINISEILMVFLYSILSCLNKRI